MMSKSRSLFATLLAVGTASAAGVAPAQAMPLQWSVTIGTPVIVAATPPLAARHVPMVVWPESRGVAYQAPSHWDRDGDRIPNRYDRLYNPRWDVDGDGIPNRRDWRDDRHRRSW